MNHRSALSVGLSLALLASCGSLVTDRRREVPAPRVVAVLPFSGPADPATRALLRGFVSSRMAEEKVLVLEREWVDRRLAEGGYLDDPARFDFKQSDAAAMCERLGADAVIAGDSVQTGESSFLVFHSSSLGARLQIYARDGRRAWMAMHSVSKKGGLALESGQIVSAVQRELGYHASRERAALAWRMVEEMFAVSGGFDGGMLAMESRPAIASAVASKRAGSSPAQRWVVVEAQGSAGAMARFDLDAKVRGVPMVELAPGRYRGIFERHPQDQLAEQPAVRIEFSDSFGHTAERGDVSWSG